MKNFGTLLMILAAAASYSVTALPAPGIEPSWIQARNNGPRFEAVEVREPKHKHHKGNGGNNNNNNNNGGGNAVGNATATAVAGAASGAASGAPAADTGNDNNGKGNKHKNNILDQIEAQGGNALTALEDLLSRDAE
ncbi:hypothetical protein GGR57DRAFT_94788 [Xylariaceae sp. FL1272]|nr:hypothetical protein GGR57DRAFT_94788 [Xylariaceae sp. FL1272]